jgi:predicted porin
MRDNMKKVLLGTSAIALAGAFATQASAAEWDVRVGGYMEQFVAYASSDFDDDDIFNAESGLDQSGDYDGIDSKQDSEIWFLPSITLDNGIKIGANIQLEGFQGGDQIDESFLFIDGSFGRILLGSENSAGYLMTYAAPDVTFLNVNSGSLTAFIPYTGDAGNIFRGTLGTTYLENVGNNDAQRFTYFTPRFAGFQVGVSYARDSLQDTNVQVNTDETLHDLFDVGANYVQSFGDFNVAVSGRWGTAAAPGPNPDIWSAGLNLGFAGFTVGGSYAEQNDAGNSNGESYDVGISYETGPWGFSVTWFHGENQGGQSFDDNGDGILDPGDSFETGEEELDQYLVGVNYKLAKGVSLGAFGAYLDFDDASDDGSGESTDGSIDGWVIGTGIKVSF